MYMQCVLHALRSNHPLIGNIVIFPCPGIPSLRELICFGDNKVNLLEKIGIGYHNFGIVLLEDDNGDRILSIEKEKGSKPEDITREIIRLWLIGKGQQPVTWKTLITVLHDTGLRELAEHIEEILHDQ